MLCHWQDCSRSFILPLSLLGLKKMSHKVSSNGVNVWYFDPESGGPHFMWVIKSVLGHHPALKMVFLVERGWLPWHPCRNSDLFSLVHAPGCLHKSVDFLSGVDVLLNLVQRKWHVCVGLYVYEWAGNVLFYLRHVENWMDSHGRW